jgi:flagellin
MSALAAQQSMKAQNEALDQAMERLSSGLRINSAADDAAGSAIASKMEAQVRSLDVAIRNSYDAISMTQTAEGALGEMENILQRTRELAVQAGNSSLSTSDRNMIQKELDALVAELDSIATKTNFNGVKLLDGSNASIDFQIGINKGDALSVELEASGTKALGLEANRTTNEYTSGRVQRFNYNTANLAASDVQLNKQNALTANFTTDLSTANTATNGAKLIKDQINLNSSVHGVTATAFNQLTSGFKSEFKMSDTFSINGAAIDIATSAANLVDNINRQVTGVTATFLME